MVSRECYRDVSRISVKGQSSCIVGACLFEQRGRSTPLHLSPTTEDRKESSE